MKEALPAVQLVHNTLWHFSTVLPFMRTAVLGVVDPNFRCVSRVLSVTHRMHCSPRGLLASLLQEGCQIHCARWRQNNAGKDILSFSWSPRVPEKRGSTKKWVLGLPLVPGTPHLPLAPARCYAKLELPVFLLLPGPPSLPLPLSFSLALARSVSLLHSWSCRGEEQHEVSADCPLQSDKFWSKCLAAAKIRFSLREEGGSRRLEWGSAAWLRTGEDKSGLCTMDESSILRRRGLQVGSHMSPCLCVCAALLGWLWPCVM